MAERSALAVSIDGKDCPAAVRSVTSEAHSKGVLQIVDTLETEATHHETLNMILLSPLFARSNAMSAGPSENSPRFAFDVRSRR